jgi:hypothetical protein
MCYSAQIRAEYKQFVRIFGAVLSVRAFSKLYFERQSDPKIKIPKAIDAQFLNPQTDDEREIGVVVLGVVVLSVQIGALAKKSPTPTTT